MSYIFYTANVPRNVWVAGERIQSILKWRTGDIISDQLEWSAEYDETDSSANHIYLKQSDEFKLSKQRTRITTFL